MDIRPSPIAGRWYPAHPADLAASIDAFLAAAGPLPAVPPEQVVALVAPHAGHRYSGGVAAHAFGAVRGVAYDTVALVCPSHFHADGPVVTTAHSAYVTPLGQVSVDTAGLAALGQALALALGLPAADLLVPIRRDREHAIEIELPFLQRVLQPGYRLLPLMLRDQSAGMARALGAALGQVLAGRRALLVASSDLSHYYPHALAQALDAELLRPIGALDPDGVLAVEADGRGQACGYGAIAAVLWAAQALGATQARVVAQTTSGETSGDYDQVVGYGAAVAWREAPAV